MDRVDVAIVEILSSDGRASNAQIARQVGVSEGTIRRRLKRMVDQKVVQIRVISDPKGLGRLSQCMVGVTVEPSEVDAVLAEVCSREEVTFAACTTGSYDLILCVSVDSSDKLGEFLLTNLGSIPGIHRIESYMLLSVGKDSLGQFTG